MDAATLHSKVDIDGLLCLRYQHRGMAKVIDLAKGKRRTIGNSNTIDTSDIPGVKRRISTIPIVVQALFFLEHAGREKGIKLTEKGQLGRNFVQAFWDIHIDGPESPFRPTRELECAEATRIHCLLAESKYIRKFNGAISLTPKGRNAFDDGPSIELYRDLLNAGVFAWNWGFEDRFPDFEFIQGSATALIAEMWRWPTDTINAAEFFDAVFENFDESGESNRRTDSAGHNGDADEAGLAFDSREWVVRCFHLRLFRRFCVPFGILRGPAEVDILGKPDEPFEKTEFFISDFPKVAMSR